MGTWFYRVFDYYPYIIFWGEKRSGKTKNLEIARELAWNPLPSSHISPASLFRMTELFQPTLLIDEADPIASAKYESDLKTMLQGGFQRDFPVWRAQEKKKVKSFIPKSFDVFSPKILAGIKGFDDVLEDRAIKIVMIRSKGEKADRKIPKNDPVLRLVVKPIMLAYAISYAPLIKLFYKKMNIDSSVLTPREKDIFKPILTLAYICDPQIYKEMLGYLEQKSIERRKEEEESRLDVLMLKVLIFTLDRNATDELEITPKKIAEEMERIFDLHVTPQKVGLMLKKLKFKDRRIVSGKYHYKIKKDYLLELCKDYDLSWENVVEELAGAEKEIENIEDIEKGFERWEE